jgi:hypothetical protein
MGTIGCAIAFGPSNDLGVTGVGFTLGSLADELYASLLAHPNYPSLLERQLGRITGDADGAIDDFLSLHDAVEALHERDLDPTLAAPLIDICDRARMVAGSPGVDRYGLPVSAEQRRAVVVLCVSSAVSGTAIVCGSGPRLGMAVAAGIGALQGHPLLRAFTANRPPYLHEIEALAEWQDPVTSELVLETELDI